MNDYLAAGSPGLRGWPTVIIFGVWPVVLVVAIVPVRRWHKK